MWPMPGGESAQRGINKELPRQQDCLCITAHAETRRVWPKQESNSVLSDSFSSVLLVLLIKRKRGLFNTASSPVGAVWLTCYGVHGLSAVVGALRWALTGRQPPCGAAGEVHVRPAGSRTPQPAARVKHPPHMPHPAGLVVKFTVKEHGGRNVAVLIMSPWDRWRLHTETWRKILTKLTKTQTVLAPF